MKTEPVHDRPIGLFLLGGFVVLGVLFQITVLPPKASASDARTGERVSFAEVERPLTDETGPVVPDAHAAPPAVDPAVVTKLEREPMAAHSPARTNMPEREKVMAAPDEFEREETIEDILPHADIPADVPEVPEPEMEKASGHAGFQVMGSPSAETLEDRNAPAIVIPPDEQPQTGTGEPGPTLQNDVTLDEESLAAQLVVLGRATAGVGDEIVYTITAENIEGLYHAPLRLSYDPEILEFVEAEEGDLLRLDGAATVFMASEGTDPGLVSIALSRMPPAAGANGSGVLCTVTFRGIAPGNSPIVLGGSRLLDEKTHDLDHVRTDSYVAIE